MASEVLGSSRSQDTETHLVVPVGSVLNFQSGEPPYYILVPISTVTRLWTVWQCSNLKLEVFNTHDKYHDISEVLFIEI